MYIIKVKGKAKIPDYIQLRDENFVLIAYFRADRPLKDLHRYGLEGKEVPLASVIEQLEFGKLQKLTLGS
ncbi:fructose-6-phosphate aldolase [Hymenobacter lutimineralis]|uniref:Fructose-6-phosphate aldolase n=1 Tax=Hymenobacter lutimineralis TaxID=2606448 RepID=A0A5D6V5E2_9BACT|nr:MULTISPECIES: fructose-6-phosphate aldolase [Hymenobacter]QIX63030.1 fructose-6-phosphate aldolase [Hymenobacter sp. BT18]TYZ10520.1 fructose-6-phosphate aldolase [Hymenobacter lutimineralis]